MYDGTANAPGVPGLELHANSILDGRRDAVAPEIPQHHQSHFTLEPSLGLFPWWELGAYFQTATRGDGGFEYAGVKLRSKLVMSPSVSERVRLGVNFEVSLLPDHYDRDHWGTETRPIVAYEDEHWLFSFNPILDLALAGSDLRSGPSFAPAGMAVRKIEHVVSFGIEYYADFGAIAAPAPLREQEQYLFEVVNLLAVSHLELNAGVGEGLTAGSNPIVIKTILGYTWEKEEPALRVGMMPRDGRRR